jgi:hypothetical protein
MVQSDAADAATGTQAGEVTGTSADFGVTRTQAGAIAGAQDDFAVNGAHADVVNGAQADVVTEMPAGAIAGAQDDFAVNGAHADVVNGAQADVVTEMPAGAIAGTQDDFAVNGAQPDAVNGAQPDAVNEAQPDAVNGAQADGVTEMQASAITGEQADNAVTGAQADVRSTRVQAEVATPRQANVGDGAQAAVVTAARPEPSQVRKDPRLSSDDRAALGMWAAAHLALFALAWAAAWAFRSTQAHAPLTRGFQNWDAALLQNVAEHGYFAPQSIADNIAFFPGYPVALAAGHLILRNWVLSELVVSGVAGCFAVVSLARLAGSRRAVLYMLMAPAVIFLMVGYTEVLFLASS